MCTRSNKNYKLDDSGNTNPNNTRWKKKIRKNNYEKQLKLEISAI